MLARAEEVFWSGTETLCGTVGGGGTNAAPIIHRNAGDGAYSAALRGTDPNGGSFVLAQKEPSFLTVSRNSAKSTGFTT